MSTARRMIVVALAALLGPALAGCTGYAADGYDNAADQANPAGQVNPVPANQVASTPTPTAAGANNAAAPAEVAGIQTDRLTAATIPKMGAAVTDGKGWILYRFDRDTANPPTSNCNGDCARVWPPVLADVTPTLQGISADLVGKVTRADGGSQLTLAGWPLYRYIGDPKPGAWKGQGVGGTWFVVAPTGKKNLSCLPTGTPTPVAPPPAGQSGGSTGGDGY